MQRVSDSVAILHRGRLVAQAPTQELIARYGSKTNTLEEAFLNLVEGEASHAS